MPARRPSATHPAPSRADRADRADAAARRLAQLAASVGAAPAGEPTVLGEPAAEPWWADHTRVAQPLADPLPAPAAEPPHLPPLLPRPGRHAARNAPADRAAGLGGWAAAVRGRAARLQLPVLGVAHLAVVALAVAVGLALTTWWVVHDRGHPLDAAADPLTPVAAAASASAPDADSDSAGSSAPPLVALPSPGPVAATGGAPTGAAAATVTVDVTGRVRRPGIVVLARGARVTDALSAAGGARRGVDLSPLNLARLLVDGEQIVVGGPPGAAPAPGSAAGPAAASGLGAGAGAGAGPLVDLNTAAQAELETLPQVGPVTAQAILAWRTEHGGFTRVDELLEVDGIGPKTLERLLPHVTV